MYRDGASGKRAFLLSSRPTGPRFARPEDKLRPGPRLPLLRSPQAFAMRFQGLRSARAAVRWVPAFAGVTSRGSKRIVSQLLG